MRQAALERDDVGGVVGAEDGVGQGEAREEVAQFLHHAALRNLLEASGLHVGMEFRAGHRHDAQRGQQARLHLIQRVGRGKEVVFDILADHALKEAMGWRARCSYLSMIGVIAPMFGLMGTVVGMIHAFAALAGGGIIADPTKLAGAISEALVNTAAGLFVAVPGFMGFYFFRNKTQEVIVAVEDIINGLLEDVPYEQLQGIKIGPQLEAELAGGAAPAAGAAAPAAAGEMPKAAPAEGAVIVPCPSCNAQIPQGIPNCPNCKSHLEWA